MRPSGERRRKHRFPYNVIIVLALESLAPCARHKPLGIAGARRDEECVLHGPWRLAHWQVALALLAEIYIVILLVLEYVRVPCRLDHVVCDGCG